jgi:hypothetical protein
MRYIAPDGRHGKMVRQQEGRALVFVDPGVTKEVQPWEYVFYPDDGSLPHIVGETLAGYEAEQ